MLLIIQIRKQSIKDIIKGKSAMLLFWNPEYYSESYIASRVNYLSTSYPNIKFIQIKIDGNDSDRIKELRYQRSILP